MSDAGAPLGERALLPAPRSPLPAGGALTGPSRSLVQEDHLDLQTVQVESNLMDSNEELTAEDEGLALEEPLCPPLPE